MVRGARCAGVQARHRHRRHVHRCRPARATTARPRDQGPLDAGRLRARRRGGRRARSSASTASMPVGSTVSCTPRRSRRTPILEGVGARTALVTTHGFRDVLEMRRLRIPVLYDIQYEHAEAARPAPSAVRGRRAARASRRACGASWTRRPCATSAQRIESRTSRRSRSRCCTRMSTMCTSGRVEEIVRGRPRRRRLRDPLVRDPARDPRVRAHVAPRSSTPTSAPRSRATSARSSTGCCEAGIEARLEVMQSSGGTLTPETAACKPAHLIESGPAAGVMACSLPRAAHGPAVG